MFTCIATEDVEMQFYIYHLIDAFIQSDFQERAF